MANVIHGSFSGLDTNDSEEYEKSFCGSLLNRIIDPTIPCIAHALGGLMRAIMGIANCFFEIAANVKKGIGGTQFTAAFLMPFGLYELACDIVGMVTSKTKEGKFDNFLDVIGGISEGADGVANITEGLVAVGSVGVEALAWAGPLSLAAAALSSIFIAIHVKAIHSNRCVFKAVKKAKKQDTKKIDVEILIRKLKKTKHAYHLKRDAGIKVNKVIKKINSIKNSDNKEIELKKIYKGIKTRIKEQQACHVLGIVIASIGIIASVILFATALTPWVIAGLALLGGLYILCMSKMGLDAVSDRKFSHLIAVST